MASKEMFHLLNVLDQRDLAFGRNDISAAFEAIDTRQAAEEWVNEYLSPTTLLTKDEYVFLEKCGEGAATTPKSPSPSGNPISDAELKAAISSLEASTAGIEKQCRVLEAQKQALQQLKSLNAGRSTAHDDSFSRDKHEKKISRENARLDLEVDELRMSLNNQMLESMKRVEGSLSGVSKGTAQLLEKDDRLLDGLQTLIPKMEAQTTEEISLEEVNDLCDILASLSAKAIRAKVDSAYRSALTRHNQQANGHGDQRGPTTSSERDAIRAELAELNGEIDGLLSIYIDNQYRTPLARSIRSSQSALASERARWSNYLTSTLQYLTSRLDTLTEHVQHVHAHHAALQTLSAAIQDLHQQEIARNRAESALVTEVTAPVSQTTTTTATTTERGGAAQKGLRPLKLLNRSSSTSDSLDSTAQILRLLDVRNVPVAWQSSDKAKLTSTLDAAVIERRERLRALQSSTRTAISRQLAHSLAHSDRDVRDVLAAVYAHSPYASVKLMDSEVESGVDGLEARTDGLADRLQALDSDALTRNVRQKQRTLLAEWDA